MKKKRIWITGALIMGMLLTGCGDLPDISEHQADLIAEYAGGVLLRYSPKYQLRLVENDLDEDGVEDSNSATGSAAELTEPDASAVPTPTAASEVATGDALATDTPPEPTEEPTVSLDELYGIKGLTFKYKSATFTDRYTQSEGFVEITPEEDQVLYVVSFDITNTSSKKLKVDLTRRAFHYELDVGGSKILPTISLLPNGGLNYLMTKIKPGQTEEAVLIFNLDKERKDTGGNVLTITEGSKSATIEL